MTEEQVKNVAELYQEKAWLLQDLSNLMNSENNFLMYYRRDFSFSPTTLNCNKRLQKEMKEILLVKIKLEVDKIDTQLNNIKC